MAFEPLSTPVSLPAAFRGKPVWVVEQLSDGQLAVGVEGAMAIGSVDGSWTTSPTPNGQVPRAISEAHGRLLVAGYGFVAFLQQGQLDAIRGPKGEFINAVAIDEGWLVSGSGGVYLVTPDGESSCLLPPSTEAKGPYRLCKIGNDLIASAIGLPPLIWHLGKLVPAENYATFSGSELGYSVGSLIVSSHGVRDLKNRSAFPTDVNKLLQKSGPVGLAESGSWILIPTFSGGLFAVDRANGTIAWTSHGFGEIYFVRRITNSFLLCTGNGLFSVSDPAKVEFKPLEGKLILGLRSSDNDHVSLVTTDGTQSLFTDDKIDAANLWPGEAGAEFAGGKLIYEGHEVRPMTRFVNGLAVAGGTAVIAQDQGITMLDRAGIDRFIPIPALANSIATDSRNFLVGTTSQGVQVLTPEGQFLAPLGSGRAAVREVRPGKVVLLFWDGTILDSDANTLGRITWGNPRDAALVQGRLAVLVTRPDRDPVVGLLEGQSWQPLEIPGLAEIGAEKIAATDDFLYAAGPRGVIRLRLPLAKSAAPAAAWSWTTAAHDGQVQLPSATFDHVGVNFHSLDLAPAPATFLRLRAADGAWSTLRPGVDFQLPVGWGRTAITLQAERNGLVTESTVTVVRPWPLWLRWWAWPLHAAALAGLVLALVRWRTRTLKQRNLELERHVSERTEQLRKASAVKEEFLASISHEIRNPLNGVVGICAMLADREVGPREKILVRTLGGCADQLRSMLDDILDFSRIERGQVTLTNVDFEAGALVEEAARAMDPGLTACSLLLPEQAAWLHGDSGKLRQIICNLISNALKYGVPSEAGVEMRLTPAGAGRTRLRLAVRNTGPTIPPEELLRLFESFQRGANTGNIPGSGLGLAVCRRLAQAMGGRITAASHEGTTEFALELTLVNAQPPARPAGLPDTVSRALAIEDEEYNRIALGHVLRSLGYTVDWAVDGASALKFASTQQYDLVLTDWRLPDIEGGELCRRLVRVLPRPTPPIVAVTAYSTNEKLEEAKAAGMTGFVTKPVTKEKLERVIRGLSEGLRPKRSLDTQNQIAAAHPHASLGDIAPSSEQLSAAIARKWREVAAMASLHDPRAASEAHTLRGHLLQAGEETAAEQVSLLEDAADRADWPAVARLQPEIDLLINASQTRLKA